MHRLTRLIGLVLIGIFGVAGMAAAAIPTVRHAALAYINDPINLPALADMPTVHYESGAEDAARAVAAVLPRALARIEAAQGRAFRQPVTIGVYISPEAYARANGVGSTGPAGVTFFGRVTLSPTVFGADRERMEAVLTHELSHAHLDSWLSPSAYFRVPVWFKEGLAVMASDGGGAEGVSDEEARRAIASGDRIEVRESGSLLNFTSLHFDSPSAPPFTVMRARLAYREASLFVADLRARDPAAFSAMLSDVLDGEPLGNAMETRYRENVPDLWAEFVRSVPAARESLAPTP